MKVDDIEIVDTLLGKNTPDFADHFDYLSDADPLTIRKHTHWTLALQSLTDQAQAGKLVQHRAIESVINTLALQRSGEDGLMVQGLRHAAVTDASPWGRDARYTGPIGATLILIALGLLALIAAMYFNYHPNHVVHVEFEAHKLPDGSIDRPYPTVAGAAARVKREGRVLLAPGTFAERLRISRPMRLFAPQGPVRIGEGARSQPLRVVE